MPEDLETEDILTQVGEGKIAATVADSNIVQMEQTYNNNIRSVGPLGDVVEIGWMMRQNQSLKGELDDFMKKFYESTFYNIMVNKYFKNFKGGPSDQKLRADHGADVPRVGLQPEGDEPGGSQRADAGHAAHRAGIENRQPGRSQQRNSCRHSSDGAVSEYFNSPEINARDRIRFALASYNCGAGHVNDAHDLAKEMGLDSSRSFGNVEKAMLLLSKRDIAKRARYGYCRCEEPVNYVSQIQNRYDHYVQIVPMRELVSR